MKKILLLIVVLFSFGCSNATTQQQKNLNSYTIKKNIFSGVTTKQELFQLLGEPNSKTQDSNGNEVWVYKSGGGTSTSIGIGLGFGGLISSRVGTGVSVGSDIPISKEKNSDYIFTFNKNNIVSDYKIINN